MEKTVHYDAVKWRKDAILAENHTSKTKHINLLETTTSNIIIIT
jgi:hypothetical protein